jgi:hypothetical protein
MTKENVVKIDGKNFNTDDLNNNQKYYIQQVQNLQLKSNKLAFEKDQIDKAKDYFVNALINSVNDDKGLQFWKLN